MVSYLLLVVVAIGVIVIGFGYGVMHDIVDIAIVSYSYTGTPLQGITDNEANTGFNILISLFQSFLILAGIVIIWFVYVMSQKPERGW